MPGYFPVFSERLVPAMFQALKLVRAWMSRMFKSTVGSEKDNAALNETEQQVPFCSKLVLQELTAWW